MSFWPHDINAEDVRSPRDILRQAGDELENRTGKLVVFIGQSPLDDRIVLSFEITNHESNVTLNLFEASHQKHQSYPVVIVPPESNIPEFLRTERYVPGSPSRIGVVSELARVMQATHGTSGHYVKNEWVCATPTEFKSKLIDLFAEDYVKCRIISLLAPTGIEEAGQSENNDPSAAAEESESEGK